MADLRTYVCYAQESVEDALFAQQLVNDLRAAGIDAISGENPPEGAMTEGILAGLQECHWVILVQTPAALRSLQVRFTIDTALDLVQQQRLLGVIAINAETHLTRDIPMSWAALKTFDASEDYPKALARLLLTLNPVLSATVPSVQVHAAPPPAFQTMMAASIPSGLEADDTPARFVPIWLRKKQLKSWLVPLSAVFALVLVIGISMEAFAMLVPHAHPASPVVKKVVTPAVGPTHVSVVAMPTPTPTIAPTPTLAPTQPPVTPAPVPDIATIAKNLYANAMQQQPTLSDTLSAQDGNNWDTSNIGDCTFANNTYNVTTAFPTAQSATWAYCLARSTNFSNFAYQAQMTYGINLPSYCGLVFRANTAADMYSSYRFYVGSDGTYELDGYQGTSLKQGMAAAINQGQTTNTIAVIAKNNDMYLYVNGQFIAHVSDNAATSGAIGMVCKAEAGAQVPAGASFQFAKVWML